MYGELFLYVPCLWGMGDFFLNIECGLKGSINEWKI